MVQRPIVNAKNDIELGALKVSRERFMRASAAIAISGLLLHISLLVFFRHIGCLEMAYFNVGSTIVWGVAFWLTLKEKIVIAFELAGIEMFLHAALSNILLGPDAGFQVYQWTIALMAVINIRWSTLKGLSIAMAVIVTFTLIYVTRHDYEYPYKYPDYLVYIYLVNLMMAAPMTIGLLSLLKVMSDNNSSRLASLAATDDLTKLYNRREATDLIRCHVEDSQSKNYPMMLVMADIDNFKRVNDTFGHDAGDAVIIAVSQHLKGQLRKGDIVARWGGEEFCLLLPYSSREGAENRIEHIRKAIFKNVVVPGHDEEKISVSFGMAEWDLALDFEANIKRADEALYESKNTGRNRLTVAL